MNGQAIDTATPGTQPEHAVEITELGGGGVRYRLPHQSSGWRWVRPLAIGLAALIGLLALLTVLSGGDAGDGWGWFFSFGLQVFAFGVGSVYAGLTLLIDPRDEIEVRDGRLRVIRQGRGVQWLRSRPLGRVTALVIDDPFDPEDEETDEVERLSLADYGELRAECDGAPPLVLLKQHEREHLRTIAGDLSDRWPHWTRRPIKVEVRDHVRDRLRETAELAASDPPPASRLRREQRGDGVMIETLPLGVWANREARASFLAGAVFAATCAAVLAWLWWMLGDVGRVIWIVALVFGALIVGGLLTVATGVAKGRRRAVLDVVGQTLLVTWTRPLGVEQRTWQPGELITITADRRKPGENGNSGWHALRIVQADGEVVTLLGGRDPDELHWIAAVLRHQLALP